VGKSPTLDGRIASELRGSKRFLSGSAALSITVFVVGFVLEVGLEHEDWIGRSGCPIICIGILAGALSVRKRMELNSAIQSHLTSVLDDPNVIPGTEQLRKKIAIDLSNARQKLSEANLELGRVLARFEAIVLCAGSLLWGFGDFIPWLILFVER
jgi:hypothetical protein